MRDEDRIDRWSADLAAVLDQACELVDRGRRVFDDDPALPLAFEALSNRVGDLAKRLAAADPERFGDPIWSLAARNRDVVVHHYQRLDPDTLWRTVESDFPRLRSLLSEREAGGGHTP